MPGRLAVFISVWLLLPDAALTAAIRFDAHADSVSISKANPPENRVAREHRIPLRRDLSADDRLTVNLNLTNVAQALAIFSELTGRQLLPRTNSVAERLDELLFGQLSRWHLIRIPSKPDPGVTFHRDGFYTASEVKETLERFLETNGVTLMPVGQKSFRAVAGGKPNTNGKTGRIGSILKNNETAAWLFGALVTFSVLVYWLRYGFRRSRPRAGN